MITFDTIVLIMVVLGGVLGFMKGFVRQVLGMLGFLAGIYISYRFSGYFTGLWLQQFQGNKTNTQIIFYIVLVSSISLLTVMLIRMVEKFLKMILLSWLNRVAGMLVGALQIILALSAVLFAYNALEFKTGQLDLWLKESTSYQQFIDLANYIYPYLNFG